MGGTSAGGEGYALQYSTLPSTCPEPSCGWAGARSTAAIDRALEAARAAGGGVVYLPRGQYCLSRQTEPSDPAPSAYSAPPHPLRPPQSWTAR